MSASSRPPKRKAAEAAESKMAKNVDQNDPIDEVLESKGLVDDGIDLHAQVHPRLVQLTSRWLVGMNRCLPRLLFIGFFVWMSKG